MSRKRAFSMKFTFEMVKLCFIVTSIKTHTHQRIRVCIGKMVTGFELHRKSPANRRNGKECTRKREKSGKIENSAQKRSQKANDYEKSL